MICRYELPEIQTQMNRQTPRIDKTLAGFTSSPKVVIMYTYALGRADVTSGHVTKYWSRKPVFSANVPSQF